MLCFAHQLRDETRFRNAILALLPDEVAEWLRRWTANPLGSARVGSNPILVAFWFYGVMVSTLDFESSDPSSNLGRTFLFAFFARIHSSSVLDRKIIFDAK